MTDKKLLRKHMLQKRQEYISHLSLEKQNWASGKICDFLSRIISPDQIIACYIPFRNEINILPLIHTLEQNGYKITLPVVNEENSLSFYEWFSTTPLEKSVWGFMVPSLKLKLCVPEVIIVPLVAFDRNGHRLGYGQGHYDRTLRKFREQKKIIAIGLAYNIQKTDIIPCEPFDEKLDYIITEKQIYQVKSI